MTKRTKEQLLNRKSISNSMVAPGSWMEDDLFTVLCVYFEADRDCPVQPDGPDGWKPWAVEKATQSIDYIVDEIESSWVHTDKSKEDFKDFAAEHLKPEDIFSEETLTKWAEENDFKRN